MNKENNILIAEFMGAESKCFGKVVVFPNKSKFFTDDNHKSHTLKYTSSWNQLIPVIEKIENLGYSTKLWYSAERKMYTFQIFNVGFIVDLHTDDKNKLKATYNTVLEFINFYNQ